MSLPRDQYIYKIDRLRGWGLGFVGCNLEKQALNLPTTQQQKGEYIYIKAKQR